MEFPGTDPDVRAHIESEVEADRWGRRRHLQEIDPAAAAKITPNDSRRIVRALEVIELTGRPFSAQLPDYQAIEPTIHLGLSVERKILHERIASRVEAMWEHGWVDEVRSLLERGLAEGRTASRAIGYAQIQQYLAGKLDRDDAPGTDDHQNPTVRTPAGHLVPQRPRASSGSTPQRATMRPMRPAPSKLWPRRRAECRLCRGSLGLSPIE